jgi:endonuclease YncB( thermonuclease family)
VAIIKLESGKILNEELLKQGLAWHYRKYDNNDTWSSLEKRAKASKKGLWQQSNPLAPWDFRHNRK